MNKNVIKIKSVTSLILTGTHRVEVGQNKVGEIKDKLIF